MSILDRIMKKKTVTENKLPEQNVDVSPANDTPVTTETAGKPVATESEPIQVKTGDQMPKPLDGIPEGVSTPSTSTIEVNAVQNDKNDYSHAEETQEKNVPVETIPLGYDELSTLSKNGYDAIKGNFTKTFLIEKAFWAKNQSSDVTNPGSRMIKVKRVAEIRAASLKHALKLIGWDDRNVTVVKETDDYKGEVGVLIDGRFICKITSPFEYDDSFTGGQRKAFAKSLKDVAIREPRIKAILDARKRVVTKWAFEPYKHISLSTSKAPKIVIPVQVVIAEPSPEPAETVAEVIPTVVVEPVLEASTKAATPQEITDQKV